MDFKTLQKIVEASQLLKEAAPSALHEDMRGSLTEWATAHGFTKKVTGWPTGYPDVLKLDASERFLCVGDAKVAKHEPPTRGLTVRRISGYLETFSELLRSKEIGGGTIAIMTDDEVVAGRWVNSMNVLALRANLSGLEPHSLPGFKVQPFANRWVISW